MIGILFIVIAAVLILMRSLIVPSKNEPEKFRGVGIVEKRIQENCRICFYVRFTDKWGNVQVAESIPYKSTMGKYDNGDSAKIWYYFSPKGRPFVVIDDEELVSCETQSKYASVVMLIAAMILIIIGVFLLIFALFA
ncbi:hypothetical protein [Pseudoflavonifractor sp. An187]|uniref:hypothetical protein n=1 Tax=Pseudoflavonifractor sp. An187 TaxID=1965578 RepID=UPI000B370BF1|nr:hypothetical protein [Pseudoflavonifractor sp. An187]OUP41489.1 hypothetical protein B5F22_10105 [Pseudoflavonifractor sp. An187]